MLQDNVVASDCALFGQVVVIEVVLILVLLQQTCQSLSVYRFLVLEECAANHCLQAGLVGKRINLIRDSILNLMVTNLSISFQES